MTQKYKKTIPPQFKTVFFPVSPMFYNPIYRIPPMFCNPIYRVSPMFHSPIYRVSPMFFGLGMGEVWGQHVWRFKKIWATCK